MSLKENSDLKVSMQLYARLPSKINTNTITLNVICLLKKRTDQCSKKEAIQSFFEFPYSTTNQKLNYTNFPNLANFFVLFFLSF